MAKWYALFPISSNKKSRTSHFCTQKNPAPHIFCAKKSPAALKQWGNTACCLSFHGIAAALGGTAKPEAFLLKIVFTAVTLGCGFKGGEIVPTLFVGSTFGCAAGALLGLPAGFAAARGSTGLFCGMTNCPLTSLLISVELFGADGLLCYAVVCAVSYVCSGYRGLYSSQTILYSKLRAEFINVHTK